jgi:hypothetical protein
MKKIFEKINFKQPKYMLPAILYIPLLAASYFIFDLFNTGKAEIPDKSLQTTEFLNPNLPDATIKGGDGIVVISDILGISSDRHRYDQSCCQYPFHIFLFLRFQ